jgi:hypothetical protein
MGFIYLHKLELPEKVRVDPDEFRMIAPMEGVVGSHVTFRNDDMMRYKETPRQIGRKEFRARYVWPNFERLTMAILGGVVGGLLTFLMQVKKP